MTGEEMVRLAAEKVMGWHWCNGFGTRWVDGNTGRDIAADDWNPFTSASDCRMVIDRMQELGYEFRIEIAGGKTFALIGRPKSQTAYHAHEADFGRAIVLASLRAIGEKV